MGARSLRLFIAQCSRRKIITIFIIQLMERTKAVKLIFAQELSSSPRQRAIGVFDFQKVVLCFFFFLSTANGRNSSWRIL